MLIFSCKPVEQTKRDLNTFDFCVHHASDIEADRDRCRLQISMLTTHSPTRASIFPTPLHIQIISLSVYEYLKAFHAISDVTLTETSKINAED